MNEKLNGKNSALLVMDYQADIVQMVSQGSNELLERANSCLTFAREAGMKIIYVVIGFRKNYPEIGQKNKIFQSIKPTGRFEAGHPGAEIDSRVAPKARDLVVVKKRVSAFAGSDLDLILRSNAIENLVLFGIATSGVVLSTLRQAADLDFNLVVVKDCCADQDTEVHRVLTEKVFPRQAHVIDSSELKDLF